MFENLECLSCNYQMVHITFSHFRYFKFQPCHGVLHFTFLWSTFLDFADKICLKRFFIYDLANIV